MPTTQLNPFTEKSQNIFNNQAARAPRNSGYQASQATKPMVSHRQNYSTNQFTSSGFDSHRGSRRLEKENSTKQLWFPSYKQAGSSYNAKIDGYNTNAQISARDSNHQDDIKGKRVFNNSMSRNPSFHQSRAGSIDKKMRVERNQFNQTL